MNSTHEELMIEGLRNDTDVVFTTENYGAFNVTLAMEHALQHGERINAILDVGHVLRCLLDADLDMKHCAELMRLSDEDLAKRTLLLYIDAGDGTHIIIDGNHRLSETARRAMMRSESNIIVPSLVITLAAAEAFRVRYIAENERGQRREVSSTEMLARLEGWHSSRDGSIRYARGEMQCSTV